MIATLVGLHGPLTGKRFPVRGATLTLGRAADSDVVLATRLASRVHAELRCEAGEHVLHDRDSRNGVEVNGRKVAVHPLRSGDEITVGDEVFRFELVEEPDRVEPNVTYALTGVALSSPVLRVTVSGGGPIGLAFALLLEQLLGTRVSITVYESRWYRGDDGVVRWKNSRHGNARRQQVVTLQSRQYLKLPAEVQERLFTDGGFTEMWPSGPDSIQGGPPRNVRIAYIEDQLLAHANEKRHRIQLVPEAFDPVAAADDLAGRHVLVICEGSRSRTREHFADRFGAGDTSPFSVDGGAPPGRGAGPASEVDAARPDGRAAHRRPEPLPAELAARRGIPQHAAHVGGDEGGRGHRPGPAGVHRVHPGPAVPDGEDPGG
jgi:hypothetical protein